MRTAFVRLFSASAVALAATALGATPAEGQKPAIVRITPYAGYLAFGDYVDGPIGTRLSNEHAAVYGVQLGLDLMPNVALVGNLGYSDSNVRVGLPLIGGLNVADSKVLLYDAGLQLRLPSSTLGGGVVPFVEAGAGAIRYEVRGGPLTANATNFAANFGGGVDVQLNRNLGLRLQAKDYVARFDFDAASDLGLRGKTAHNISFNVGVNLGF